MPTQLTTRRAMPLAHRPASLQPASFNADARTLTVCWTTGARVRRTDLWSGTSYEEELVVSPDSVDMSRFDAGSVQVLDSHDRFAGMSAILGVVDRAWIQSGQGLADIRLSQRPELAGLVADIGAGIARNLSCGYSVDRYEVTPAALRKDGGTLDLWRAVRWSPHEISFVSVPADPGASTRAAPIHYPCEIQTLQSSQEQAMTETTTQTATAPDTQRAADVAEIRSLNTRHRLPEPFVADLIQRDLPLDQARAAMLTELARRDFETGGHLNVRSLPSTGSEATPLQMMTDALVHRMGGTAAQPANQYRHMRVADMAREILEVRGVRTTDFAPGRLIDRALTTTSDFPTLLQGSSQRVLRDAYDSYGGGIKRIAKASVSRDFRAKASVALSEYPELLKVGEHSEFKYGARAEAKTSYSLATYGRIFGISRQALINDDLSAFADMSQAIGRAAAELEANLLVTLLTSNPAMSDGVALFHAATHGNLGTGAGSALQLSSLTTARTAMRLQKGLDGKTAIDAQPVYLIVPAALETTGEQLIATLQPQTVSAVNPFAGRLELVVDPRLDAVSATAWYLATDPGRVETIQYAYLEDAAGPEVIVREGFEVDGLELKGRLDFGAGVLDWRGLYRANGA